jgi:hypothetical protein
VTIDGVWIGEVELFTTYITRNYKQSHRHRQSPQFIRSPQHPPSLFKPAICSPIVSWQRLLTVEILQLHALRSYLHSLPCRTQLGRPRCLQDNYSARPTQKTQPLYCCRGVFTASFHSNGRCADHIKHRSSIVACVYVAGLTQQRPLFTGSPLSNGSTFVLTLLTTQHTHIMQYYAITLLSVVSWGKLGPLGTSATNWPIVPAPDES